MKTTTTFALAGAAALLVLAGCASKPDSYYTLATLNKTLTSTEQTVSRINSDVTPELAAAMKDVRKTVNSAERTLADDSPLQQDMRQTLRELTRAAGSVRVLTDYLERHPESLLRGKPDDKK